MKFNEDKLEKFCKRHYIRRLSVFGSVLHGNSDPDSDVDILVEFEQGHEPGLDFFLMEDELSALIGRKVDLNTPAFLSRYFRQEVMNKAEVHYAQSL